MTTQLAVRFSGDQIDTLDALAAESGLTRSAVLRKLVDEAERARIAEAYRRAYPPGERIIDAWGDLTAFHEAAAHERATDGSLGDPW